MAPKYSKKMRAKLKGGGECFGCGMIREAGQMEYHHIIPIAEGGKRGYKNVIALCKPCHYAIHGRMVRNGKKRMKISDTMVAFCVMTELKKLIESKMEELRVKDG